MGLAVLGLLAGVWAATSHDDWFLAVGAAFVLVAFGPQLPKKIGLGPRGVDVEWPTIVPGLITRDTPANREIARQVTDVLVDISGQPDELAKVLRDVLHARVEAPEAATRGEKVLPEEYAAPTRFAAGWVASSAPHMTASPGAYLQLSCVYQNVGTEAWVKADREREARIVPVPPQDRTLLDRGWLPQWAGNVFAVQVNDLVAPGQLGSFVWIMRIPDGTPPGRYDIHYQPAVGGAVIGPDEYFEVRVES